MQDFLETLHVWLHRRKRFFFSEEWPLIFGSPTCLTTLPHALLFFFFRKLAPMLLENPHVWLRCSRHFFFFFRRMVPRKEWLRMQEKEGINENYTPTVPFKRILDRGKGSRLLARYVIPGCAGRGSSWDLRVRPAAALASGNLKIWESGNLGSRTPPPQKT